MPTVWDPGDGSELATRTRICHSVVDVTGPRSRTAGKSWLVSAKQTNSQEIWFIAKDHMDRHVSTGPIQVCNGFCGAVHISIHSLKSRRYKFQNGCWRKLPTASWSRVQAKVTPS